MLTDTGSNRHDGRLGGVCGSWSKHARTGSTDNEILVRSPVVLALTAPRVGPGARAAG